MSGIDYHGALAPLEEACRLAEADILFVDTLMQTKSMTESTARKIGIALRHIQFAWSVFVNRKRPLILIRDFSNVPLAAVFPLIRWKRSRMIFVVNHNLQWTMESPVERMAFRCLGRWGCRFAFLEQVPADLLEQYGMDPRRCLALPHPVPQTSFKRDRKDGVRTVGLIGQYRPEKGLDDLLDVLDAYNDRYRILLAIPNKAEFLRHSAHAGEDWFDVVDTSAYEAYLKAISECDAIVLNHPPEGYAFRASGLIADAAAARVPVVTRDLFIMRHQLSHPVPVGECFDDLSDIPDCLERVSGKLVKDEYDFSTYHEARSSRSLASQLNQLCSQPAKI